MSTLPDNKYEGKPCRHRHLTENNTTLRYTRNGSCVECQLTHQRNWRSKSDDYKDYQHEYHQMLRSDDPERLFQYYLTRKKNGHP